MGFNRRAILTRRPRRPCALAAPHAAMAQAAYPTKPITLIVPAAAGGPTDTVARLIAESMSRTLGQTVLVENVGGAGGTLGMARVAELPRRTATRSRSGTSRTPPRPRSTTTSNTTSSTTSIISAASPMCR